MYSLLMVAVEAALLLPLSAVAHAVPSSHAPPSSNASLYPPYTYHPGVYIPSTQGIPFTQYNGRKPWLTKPSSSKRPHAASNANCVAPPTASVAADDYWYANILHNGESPFITDSNQYTVYRNAVTDFGADPSGNTDSSAALQNAINAGTNSDGRNDSGAFGTTGQPAVIYLPPGTYQLDNPIQLYVDTFIVGNPISPPTLKASSGFNGNYIVYGKDPSYDATVNFYIGIKNLIIDSTAVDASSQLTLLDWSVSQATQLANLVFQMPQGSSHTGLSTPEGGSGTMIGDLTFNGGAVGINMNNQQYEIKSVIFNGCSTGVYVAHCFDCVFVNCQFNNNQYGIDMTATDNTIGAIVVVDSSASGISSAVVRTNAESTGDHTLVIDNFESGSGVQAVVTASGNSVLTGSVSGSAWVYGNAYTPGGPSTGSHQTGTTYSASRPNALTSNGKYVTVSPPTYQDYPLSSFVNVKNVSGLLVYGDGVHDDTDNLNTIISQNAGCSILFFPQGTYLVSNTLYFPPGSRVVGEALSTISANGPNFQDANNPIPMVQVGQSGATGVAQFSDMLFTVADILPGCILVQVNLAGETAGDVGFWNSHFRIGGALGSNVYNSCDSPDDCKAAFMVMQLTSTSSVYVENMWGWTADHDLDGNQGGSISTGRGLLVQGTTATWLHGVAFEHHTLYQFNFDHASNIFTGMQQSETPYWQGASQDLAPTPWTPNSAYADPDFSGCDSSDTQCRMAWFNIITSSSDIHLYGGGFWTFFNNNSGDCQNSNVCQTNAINVQDAQSLYWFGISTHCNLNVVVNDGSALVTQNNNPGSWGACVGAFLTDS